MFTQKDSLSTDTDAVDSDGPYHLKLSSVIGRFKTPTFISFIYLCLALKKWKQLQYIKNSKQHFYMINIIICDESFKYGPSTWLFTWIPSLPMGFDTSHFEDALGNDLWCESKHGVITDPIDNY